MIDGVCKKLYTKNTRIVITTFKLHFVSYKGGIHKK